MNPDLLRIILPPKNANGYLPHQNGTDSDRAIILPIVILLLAERADFFLIFALLYILL